MLLPKMRNRVEEKFLEFYEQWIYQLEQHLNQLLIAQQLITTPNLDPTNPIPTHEHDLRALISNLTSHHKVYYNAKWAAVREDVLAFFGPAWLSPLEKAHFWLTGWKPSSAFRLLDQIRKSRRPAPELGDAHVNKLEELRAKIRLEEEKVEREMERYQVAVADRKMLELARLVCHVTTVGGDSDAAARVEGLVATAVKGIGAGLEKVVKAADCVRLKTLKGILDILTPPQSVEFLAAVSAFQVQLRRRGVQKHSLYSAS